MGRGLACVSMIILVLLTCGCSEYPQRQGGTPVVTFPPEKTAVTPEITLPATISPETEEEAGEGHIRFYPGGEYHAGDRVVISGTTNLHPGNNLLVEITSVSFYPTNKSEDARFYGVSDVVTVLKGPDDRNNTWSYTLNTTDLAPDRYDVLVSGITTLTFRKTASFELLP